MAKRTSLMEDIFEMSFKYPVFGLVLSLLFTGGSIYFNHKESPKMISGVNILYGKMLALLAVIVAFVSCVGLIIGYFKRKKKAEYFDSRETLSDLKRLSWQEFEQYVAHFFEKNGFTVEVTGGLNDGGVDVVVRKNGRTHLVQCKHFNSKQVTLSMVRDFYGAMSSRGNLEKGYFVTTGHATLEALKFCEDNSIELIDGARLVEYSEMTSSKVPINSVPKPFTTSASTSKESETKLCSKCGAPMVVRVAKKGTHVNKPFWGCTNYPTCKAIAPY